MDGYRSFKRDRPRRRGVGEALYVREDPDCLVHDDDTDDRVECLWVRIRRKANKVDIMMGVCCRPPNKDQEVDEVLYRCLEKVSITGSCSCEGLIFPAGI